MLRPIIAAASLVLIAGISLACSKGPLAGDTTFSEAKKGFEKEMTAAQRKAAIRICRYKPIGKRNNVRGSMHILWLAILVAIPACTSREAHTTDRTVTPLPPQVVTPVNPPPASH